MIRIEHDGFSINFDRALQLMTIIMRGYWNPDGQAAYDRELRRAMSMLAAEGCKPGDQSMLIDIAEFAVQSAGSQEMFERLAKDRMISGRHRALVLSTSMLLTMQARRVAPNYEMFQDGNAARDWLIAQTMSPIGSRDA